MSRYSLPSAVPAASKKDHPRTELSYRMRPENYKSGHPLAAQHFLVAKEYDHQPVEIPSQVMKREREHFLYRLYRSVQKDLRMAGVADFYDDRYESDTSDEIEETGKSLFTISSKQSEINDFTTKVEFSNVRQKAGTPDFLPTTNSRRKSEPRRLNEYLRTEKRPETAVSRLEVKKTEQRKGSGKMSFSASNIREGRINDLKGGSVCKLREATSQQGHKMSAQLLQTSISFGSNVATPAASTTRMTARKQRSMTGEIKKQASRSESTLLSQASYSTCDCSLESGHFDAQDHIHAQHVCSLSTRQHIEELRSSISRARPGSVVSSFRENKMFQMTPGVRAFQHAVRMTMIVREICNCLIKKSFQKAEDICMLSAVTKVTHADDGQGYIFDPSFYRFRGDPFVTKEVKLILSTPIEKRTPKQIAIAMYGLHDVKAFAEYPTHIQEKLCKVGWYSVVGHNRVVIRQGHVAENFYFIIVGKAVVTLVEEDPATGDTVSRTCGIIRRGMSFGELALIHHAPRTATVRSSGELQLLTIGRQDFFDIFSSMGKFIGSLPEYLHFLSQLEFMKHWPVRNLLGMPDSCTCTYFRPGSLIVHSSLQSDWIYVVMRGECQVIKRMHKVKPRLFFKKKDPALSGKMPFAQMEIQNFKSKVNTGLSAIRRTSHESPSVSPASKMSLKKSKAVSKPRQRVEVKGKAKVGFKANDEKKVNAEDNCEVKDESESEDDDDIKQEVKTKDQDDVKPEPSPLRTSVSEELEEYILLKGPPRFLDRSSSFHHTMKERGDSAVSEDMESREGPRTSEDLLPKRKLCRRPTIPEMMEPQPEMEKDVVFLEIEKLGPGRVFGLETMGFFDSSDVPEMDVCLVSHGAECILLKKEVFQKLATAEVRRRVHLLSPVYPDENTLINQMQVIEEWNLYKTEVLKKQTAFKTLRRFSSRVGS